MHFTDLDDGLPADLESFGELVQLEIGDERSDAADTFSAMVCSPSWLSRECNRRGPVWGRHFLIGDRFDRSAIRAAIEDFCAACSGNSWGDVADQLQRLADWEFALYDTEGQPRSSGSFGKLVAVDCGGSELSDYRPARTDSFRIPLRIALGDGSDSTMDFGLTACTPDQLGAPRGKFVSGYGLLIVADYDSARIHEAIKRRVERIWGASLDDLIKKMAQYAVPLFR
jgi:hypothetical protein